MSSISNPGGLAGPDRPALPFSSGAWAPHRRLRINGVVAPAHAALSVPGVWRANACAQPGSTWPSGHAALDAELPGGGWPAGGLVELLCAQPGLYEGSLLAAHWAGVTHAQPAARLAWVMLGHSPWRLHGPGVAHLGLQPQRLLVVQPATEADAAWSVEQMLNSPGICGLWWITRHAQAPPPPRPHCAAHPAGTPQFSPRPLASRPVPYPRPPPPHLHDWTRGCP